jgi:glycerate dehydrogenase
MEIVITDGFTLNPGDLSWQGIDALGSMQYYDRTKQVEVIDRCYNAAIIVTNKTIINAAVINAATQLKMIAVTATGYNNIDIAVAKKKGIVVCNVPGYGTSSVAQQTFSLLLQLTNHVGINAASVANGEWATAKDWCYSIKPIIELKDKVLGIIGMGKIGRQVAAIAKAFGMQVIYFGGKEKAGTARQVNMYELFMQSDVVSLHCPQTSDNHAFVNKEILELMKASSFLINTARGTLINEKDLAQALQQNRIAGAALDVISTEPPVKLNPLIGLPNCIVTPHNAWMSAAARRCILETTIENIQAFKKERPQNVVNQ